MEQKKKDFYVDLKSIQNVKNKYVYELRTIMSYADEELKKVHNEKMEAINGCKIIAKDFKEQDIDNILKDNLDEIFEEAKEKYLQKTVEEILYKEIVKGIVKSIATINKVNVRNISRLTNRAGDEIVAQGIKELK